MLYDQNTKHIHQKMHLGWTIQEKFRNIEYIMTKSHMVLERGECAVFEYTMTGDFPY